MEYWLLQKNGYEIKVKNRAMLFILFLRGWKITGKAMFLERRRWREIRRD